MVPGFRTKYQRTKCQKTGNRIETCQWIVARPRHLSCFTPQNGVKHDKIIFHEFFCVCNVFSFSLSLSPLYLSLSLSLSTVSVSLSPSLSLSIYLSLSFSLSLYVSFSLARSHVSFSIVLSFSHPSLYFSLSVALSLSISHPCLSTYPPKKNFTNRSGSFL